MTNGTKGMYKKHFLHFLKSLLWLYLSFVIVAICSTYLLNGIIAPHYEKIAKTVENIGYTGVVETSCEADGITPLYKLQNLVTIKSGDGKLINVNLYSTSDKASNGIPYLECSQTSLNENGIIVSKKIAQTLNIGIGAEVYVEYSFKEDLTTYTIVGITDYLTDFYNFEKNTDFSVAIVGTTNHLEEKAVGKYVSLVNEEDLHSYLIGERSYSALFQTQEEIDILKQKSTVKNMIIGTIYFLLVLCLSIFTKEKIGSEIHKYFRAGYPIKEVLKLRNMDYVFFVGLPQIIVLLALVPVAVMNDFNLILLSAMVLNLPIVLLTLFRKGKYATAYKF